LFNPGLNLIRIFFQVKIRIKVRVVVVTVRKDLSAIRRRRQMPCDDIPSPKLDFPGPKEPASHPAFIFPIAPTSSNINFRWPGRQDPYCALSHDGACVAWHVYYYLFRVLGSPSSPQSWFQRLSVPCISRHELLWSSVSVSQFPARWVLYRGVLVRYPCLCFYREHERGCQCRCARRVEVGGLK
jgi:hypothetical protein